MKLSEARFQATHLTSHKGTSLNSGGVCTVLGEGGTTRQLALTIGRRGGN